MRDQGIRGDLHQYRAMLGALSPFDVGQAAVVAAERIVAVEGPEGTDRMLARARALGRKPFGQGTAPKGTVLVKLPKLGQDLRIDLPAIGPRTVRRAADAGCAGIAIGAGHTLVIDAPQTVAAADAAGLFLIGVEVAP